jgi:hypothetical protein
MDLNAGNLPKRQRMAPDEPDTVDGSTGRQRNPSADAASSNDSPGADEKDDMMIDEQKSSATPEEQMSSPGKDSACSSGNTKENADALSVDHAEGIPAEDSQPPDSPGETPSEEEAPSGRWRQKKPQVMLPHKESRNMPSRPSSEDTKKFHDGWTEAEAALFHRGYEIYGDNFCCIALLVATKSCKDVCFLFFFFSHLPSLSFSSFSFHDHREIDV